jgi:hypothetical protein
VPFKRNVQRYTEGNMPDDIQGEIQECLANRDEHWVGQSGPL